MGQLHHTCTLPKEIPISARHTTPQPRLLMGTSSTPANSRSLAHVVHCVALLLCDRAQSVCPQHHARNVSILELSCGVPCLHCVIVLCPNPERVATDCASVRASLLIPPASHTYSCGAASRESTGVGVGERCSWCSRICVSATQILQSIASVDCVHGVCTHLHTHLSSGSCVPRFDWRWVNVLGDPVLWWSQAQTIGLH